MHAEPDALFALNPPEIGESAMEKSVRESIAAIHAERPISATKMFLAQTAIELARSISKGNMKGRAVAMESAQLVATLDLLNPADEENTDDLPPELKALLDAFSASPVSGTGSPAPVHAA